jgi:RNA-directed DNA polymerase
VHHHGAETILRKLSDLSNMFGPVIRGWAIYYGRFHPSALKPLWRREND